MTGEETERAEQGHFGEAQSRRNAIPERRTGTGHPRHCTYLKIPEHRLNSLNLTEAAAQQWLDWCHTLRLLVSELREQWSTVRGLKDALDKRAKVWNDGTRAHDQGVAMAGVKECLLFLFKLREHE